MLGGGLDINVVHAHAGAAHDAQHLGGPDDFFGDLGFGPHDQRRGVGHQRQEFRLGEPVGQHDDIKFRPLLEQRDAFGGDGVANDDFHNGLKIGNKF